MEAKERVQAGFRHALKMKVGMESDFEQELAVGTAAEVPLRPDNNQGHTIGTCLEMYRKLLDEGVSFELLEDPCPSNWDDYDALAGELGVGILVHEGWSSLKDVGDLIKADKPGIRCVNITFGQWGIRRTYQIAGALECGGIGWSMMSYNSDIERAGALHVGVVVPNTIHPADVLGPTYVDTLLVEPLDVGSGDGVPPDMPGLGIELDEDMLEKYAIADS